MSDKKTIQGKVHFVLPEKIGVAKVVSASTISRCWKRSGPRSHEGHHAPGARANRMRHDGCARCSDGRPRYDLANHVLSFNIDKHWRPITVKRVLKCSAVQALWCSISAAAQATCCGARTRT